MDFFIQVGTYLKAYVTAEPHFYILPGKGLVPYDLLDSRERVT